jgi:Ulp1 family protease
MQLLDSGMRSEKIQFVDSIKRSKNRTLKLGPKNFECMRSEYLLMPVYGSMHWSLVVIKNASSLLQMEQAGMKKKKTMIIHYDSLQVGGHSAQYVTKFVRDFFSDAAKAGICTAMELPEIEKGYDCVGDQENGVDCALFVCKYIEHTFRKHLVDGHGIKNITQTLCSEFRKELATLLVRLSCYHSKAREKYS